MYSISQLQTIINQSIKDKQYVGSPAELYEPINYLMALGGKRMRPVFLLMAYDLFGNDIKEAINPALGIEVFHNFTLMHDDIMDKAPLRRNMPTVHKKWSESAAILSGDVMLIEAYKLVMQVNSTVLAKVLTVFNDTAVGVCEGQQIDMNFEKVDDVEVDEYINMIRLKTAILLGAALKIGAIIGNSNQVTSNLLYEFGVNMGLAFQLQDDILDVYGDPEKFGKQVGGDIISNKKTFMLIKAKELAKGKIEISLNHWLNETDKHLEKVKALTAIYDTLEVRQLAETEMTNFAKMAINSLNQITVSEDKKETLRSFAESILVREH